VEKSRGVGFVNEQRRWHGTSCLCNITITNTFCSSQTCVVCSIANKGFQMQFAGKIGTNFGRGLYFAKDPKKSHDYNTGTEHTAGRRCMFLTNVILGKIEDRGSRPDPTITGPAYGYDSVHGFVNADEYIVYRDDAVIPSYLVIYEF